MGLQPHIAASSSTVFRTVIHPSKNILLKVIFFLACMFTHKATLNFMRIIANNKALRFIWELS